jgi:predicted RNase H-like HicB family nuclease
MKAAFTAVIERDADTGLLVGYVPGFAGAHSQGATLDELQRNLREAVGVDKSEAVEKA